MSITFTDKQIQYMRLLAKGYNDSQIGKEMGVTRQMAQKHLEYIKNKLGVFQRSSVVEYAKEMYGVEVE
jgi:DNA-binding NarL/FixJ family response regulator